IVILHFFLEKRKLRGDAINGPKGLPIVGNILEINDKTIHFKFTDYAQKFGEIFRLKMLMDNVIVLNSENIIRKAFGGEKYKRYFGDRGEMFYGEHFRCHSQSLGFAPSGSGVFYRTARKNYVRALHMRGTQNSKDNIMVEMAKLVKRLEDKSGREFEFVSLLQRSLSNVMSLDLCGKTIPDNDPDSNLFWDHVRGNDFFLGSYVNFVLTTFPFLRYLPGKYGDTFRKAKKANGKIAKRYFYDMKTTTNRTELLLYMCNIFPENLCFYEKEGHVLI
ncbi:vitamin D(3) 25-hydroxylase-like, partial [Mercenaria mercenaria]|uniref:vitamin D(3) 25-hydroxylase-like n=1 Tax=Mercenaria mercenaria TaxID=6596 RepID=UPI00234E712D